MEPRAARQPANKLLLAVDDSDGSRQAVRWVVRNFGRAPDLRVTLLHVLPEIPSRFWDDGHILSRRESAARKAVVARWEEKGRVRVAACLRWAAARLTTAGVAPECVESKTATTERHNVADAVLEEARRGGYRTLVLGRNCGHHRALHAVLGSVAETVVNRAADLAVCVVE
ncbi:MAG: universal stress protein [Elusimicrobia bacterium]|nr:universal stress protein [Elusimicrobiota bacterium]